MPCQNDAWDCWYENQGEILGKTQRQVKCRFCPHTIAYRIDRMLVHLGYRTLQGGSYDGTICRMVRPSIRSLFEKCAGIVLEIIGDSTQDLEALPLHNETLVEPVLF